MKKFLVLIFVVFVTTLSIPMVCFAAVGETFEDPNDLPLIYTILTDDETSKTVSVKRNENKNMSTTIEIPATVENANDSKTYKVTKIEDNAFFDCSGLTSVTFENTEEKLSQLTAIGSSAFCNCEKLKSIDIPDSVTSIGNLAFYNCSSLESITIPEDVESIGQGTFSGCSGLKSITIPNNVTSIGRAAFDTCSSLESITIPEDVESIGEFAFNCCSGLKSIIIPSKVTSIEKGAFGGCSGLNSITIPDGVTSIKEDAFLNCSGLIFIDIPRSVKSIEKGAFGGCSSLKSIAISNGVESIEESAFKDCSGLKSITIPSSVKTIGNDAFYNCSGLNSIIIPSKVTSIGNYAFYNCSGLNSIIIPSKVTSIGNYAFYGCKSLTSITIPDGVTEIGNSTFKNCSGLTSITIPDGVTSIGTHAFDGCSSLTTVKFEDSSKLTKIEGSAFSGCSSLTSITIPDGVLYVKRNSFSNCSELTSITIPASVFSFGGNVFTGCSKLKSIKIACNFDKNKFTQYSSGINLSIDDSDKYTVTYWDYDTNTEKTTDKCTFKYVHNLSYEDNGEGKHIGICKNKDCCKKTDDGDYTTEAKAHSLGNLINEVPATCTTNGTKAHYDCSVCDTHFADKEGTTPITDLTIPAPGHDYKKEIIQPTEKKLGGTRHVCSRCKDEYWTDFTKDDAYAQTVMPNGDTIYHYCTKNGLAAKTTVDVGDGQTLKVFLQDPLRALKTDNNDVLGINVQYVQEGSDRYNELMSQVDGDHPIEHIKFFDVNPTVNGNIIDDKLSKPVYMEYEIPDGWDEEDLEMILVKDGDDQEFDETVLDIDGKKYLSMWKNHFSPYAMIDKLSEKEQAELDKQKNEQNTQKEAELLKSDNQKIQSHSQIRTGDETGYIVFISFSLIIITGLYFGLCIKKKKES